MLRIGRGTARRLMVIGRIESIHVGLGTKRKTLRTTAEKVNEFKRISQPRDIKKEHREIQERLKAGEWL